jgi:hypothetical protein
MSENGASSKNKKQKTINKQQTNKPQKPQTQKTSHKKRTKTPKPRPTPHQFGMCGPVFFENEQ